MGVGGRRYQTQASYKRHSLRRGVECRVALNSALVQPCLGLCVSALTAHPACAATVYDALVPLQAVAEYLPPTPSPLLGEACTLLLSAAKTLAQGPHNWDVVRRILDTLTLFVEHDALVLVNGQGTVSNGDVTVITTTDSGRGVHCGRHLLDEGLPSCLGGILKAVTLETIHLKCMSPMAGMDMEADAPVSMHTHTHKESGSAPLSAVAGATPVVGTGTATSRVVTSVATVERRRTERDTTVTVATVSPGVGAVVKGHLAPSKVDREDILKAKFLALQNCSVSIPQPMVETRGEVGKRLPTQFLVGPEGKRKIGMDGNKDGESEEVQSEEVDREEGEMDEVDTEEGESEEGEMEDVDYLLDVEDVDIEEGGSEEGEMDDGESEDVDIEEGESEEGEMDDVESEADGPALASAAPVRVHAVTAREGHGEVESTQGSVDPLVDAVERVREWRKTTAKKASHDRDKVLNALFRARERVDLSLSLRYQLVCSRVTGRTTTRPPKKTATAKAVANLPERLALGHVIESAFELLSCVVQASLPTYDLDCSRGQAFNIPNLESLLKLVTQYGELCPESAYLALAPLTMHGDSCNLLFDAGILQTLLAIVEKTPKREPLVSRFTRMLLDSETSIHNGTLRPGFLPLLHRILPHSPVSISGLLDPDEARPRTMRCLRMALTRGVLTEEGCTSLVSGPHSLPSLTHPLAALLTCSVRVSNRETADMQAVAEGTYVLRILAQRGLALPPKYHKDIHAAVTEVLLLKSLDPLSVGHAATVLFNMTVIEESPSESTATQTCTPDTVKALVGKVSSFHSHKGDYMVALLAFWRLVTLWSGNEANLSTLQCVVPLVQTSRSMGSMGRHVYHQRHGVSGDGTQLSLTDLYSTTQTAEGHTIARPRTCANVQSMVLSELWYMGRRLDSFFKV
ncbi:hypothetical protein KIPB_000505 [Kipferlia bialata]|uniref:Uncharacterized protein n=1 Tax=Kipferlia bialata TaxID=797122 RepID=A0A9K3CNQ2_9EUKA|nr:hypothetical protein KIPB_000505 [Kipferlia bialata]|eukprot:g505.t1